jgi:hypothetical protein
MKKIFTLTLALAATLFSATTFAAEYPNPNSNISIRSNSSSFIQVVVDGRQYNMDCNGFTTDFIRPGRHSIEVYQVNNYGFRRRPRMIYSTTMDLRPWESINVNIDRFSRVFVDSHANRDGGYNRGYDRDHDNDRWNHDRDGDHDGGYRH